MAQTIDWSRVPPSYARLPDPVFQIGIGEVNIPVIRMPEELLSKRLQGIGVEVYVMLGFMAEPGNIKRIPAQYMIERALQTGALKEGEELVEPTSGNMGVSMAFCGKHRNVRLTAIVSNTLPAGKRLPIERQGGVVLTESKGAELLGLHDSPGVIKLAQEYARQRGARFLNQYASPWNPQSYEEQVAPIVWERLGGRMSMLVSATGSKGTLLGFGRYFKAQHPDLLIVSTMPYLGQNIDGTRDLERQRESSHDLAELGALEEPIDEVTARAYSAKLNEAGIPGGPSAGSVWASLQHILLVRLGNKSIEQLRGRGGKIVVFTMFADTLYPYG